MIDFTGDWNDQYDEGSAVDNDDVRWPLAETLCNSEDDLPQHGLYMLGEFDHRSDSGDAESGF
jgi:hypothetical protein